MYHFELVFFLDKYPGVDLLGHMIALFLDFEKTSYYFPKWLHQFTLLSTEYQGSLFSISLPTFVICGLFDDNYSDRYEVIFFN